MFLMSIGCIAPAGDEIVKVFLAGSAVAVSIVMVLSTSEAQQAKSVVARSAALVITNSLIPRAFPAGFTAFGFKFHFLIDLAPS